MSNIFRTFAVLKPDLRVDSIDVGHGFYEMLDSRYDGFRSHVLVSAHAFEADWPALEVHPAGDETVMRNRPARVGSPPTEPARGIVYTSAP